MGGFFPAVAGHAHAWIFNFGLALLRSRPRRLGRSFEGRRRGPPRARREGARTFPHSQECGNDVGRGVGGMGLERGDLGDVAAT